VQEEFQPDQDLGFRLEGCQEDKSEVTEEVNVGEDDEDESQQQYRC